MAVGQVIALSGKTGTSGGHYGAMGYPHLHLTTRKSENGVIQGSQLIDPLMIYDEASSKYRESGYSPRRKRAITIPYVTTDGRIWPHDTLVVWPIACRLG